MTETEYYLGFSNFSGIGPVRFKKLLNHFGTAKDAWEAPTLDISAVIGQVITAQFDDFRKKFSFDTFLKQLEQTSTSYIALCDTNYPILLNEIPKAPLVLYIKGSPSVLAEEKGIAVVGTRKITSYGTEVTELLTYELVQAGFTIISGLALGVDACAHVTTINSKGKTIAVLGCGVNCCSPRENTKLYNSIIDHNGVIVSELPLNHDPTVGSFPARNRIIAGLSVATLVTEGAEDSGALITADYAVQYNRPVFAVPGPITSTLSKGPYKLIEKGAKLVTNAHDILNHLHVQNKKNGLLKQSIRFENKEEEMVGNLLQEEQLTFDELVRKLKLDPSQLGTILSMMEIKGIIKSQRSGKFSITS